MNRVRVLPVLLAALAVAGAVWLARPRDEAPPVREPERVERVPEGTVALAAAGRRDVDVAPEAPSPPDFEALRAAVGGEDAAARVAALRSLTAGLGFDRALALLLLALEADGTHEERALAQRALHAMGPRVVPLLEPLLRSESEVTRFWAVGILSWRAGTDGAALASPFLAAALEDEMGRVRATALRACAFGVEADPGVVRALEALLDSEYGDERRLAAEALAAMGPASLEAVWPLLDSPDGTRWALAGVAISRIRPADVRAVKAHLHDALSHADASIAGKAAAALRAVADDEDVLPWLRAALAGSEEVRRGALWALGGRSTLPDDVFAAIVAALRSENPTTSQWAAQALGRVRDRETDARAVEALVAALIDRLDHNGLVALQALGGAGTLGLLEVLDRGASAEARRGALHVVLERRPMVPGLEPRLLRIAADAADPVARDAFFALATADPARAELPGIARRILREPDPEGESLWNLEPILAVLVAAKADLGAEILALLRSPEASLRRRGLDLLVQAEPPDLRPFAEVFAALCDDEDVGVRRGLTKALWRLTAQGDEGKGTARPLLRALAEDEDDYVRNSAHRILKHIGD